MKLNRLLIFNLMNLRNFLLKSFNFIFIYLFLIIFFVLSLTFISSFSSSFLKNNLSRSINELKKEGIYPTIGFPWRKIILDNFTNALMINVAYSIDNKKPFFSAMNNIFYDNKTDKNNQILNLEELYQKKDIRPVNYFRYWHGYLIYLRSLLVFFSYSEIRVILNLFLYLLFLYFVYLSWQRLGKKTTLAFILGFLAVDFFYVGFSLSFFSVFFIGLIFGVYLLKKDKEIRNPSYIFFIVGGLTSFFDLLSSPLVSLGILLLIFIKLRKFYLKEIFLGCFFFTLGYLLIWVSKWLIVESLFFSGAINQGISQILNRTISQPDIDFSYLKTLKLNLFQLIGYDKRNKIIVLLLSIFATIFLIINFSFKKEKFKKIVSLLFVASLPYFWYLIAANHSYIHVWFTYRNQLMTVVALAMIYFELVK